MDRADPVMFLLGACKSTGLKDDDKCSGSSECCSGCCFGGFCSDDYYCDNFCMKTGRLSWCNEDENCCDKCCLDGQCQQSDACPSFPPAWLIWVLCISGGIIVVGVAVCIIMCVMRSNRNENANNVAYSQV